MKRHDFRRGDVVLVSVPFAGGHGSKRRPSVVISSESYHTAQPQNILIARISANVAGHQTATDYTLKDWEAAGLHVPSVANIVLFTIEPSDIYAPIGHLSDHDLAGIETCLRIALDLPYTNELGRGVRKSEHDQSGTGAGGLSTGEAGSDPA